jgi:hypothetical protein
VSKEKEVRRENQISDKGTMLCLVQNNMPPKLNDFCSFTTPYFLGEIKFKNTLCDPGTSVNLMPRFNFESLGI